MSRIGKQPVVITEGVNIDIDKSNVVTVKGPKGELRQKVDLGITMSIADGELTLERHNESKKMKSLHGLYRSLISNMVTGVTEGYKIEQELVGVGYRASNKGQRLELSLGFSHDIVFEIPSEITLETEMVKGKNPSITLQSVDKQLIGAVAAKIRSLRPPEPYKGKGVRFIGEQVRRKAGKSAAAV